MTDGFWKHPPRKQHEPLRWRGLALAFLATTALTIAAAFASDPMGAIKHHECPTEAC